MSHPDLAAEQAHVDHAYERLEAMRAAAAEMLHTAFVERGGTFQAVTERDIRVRTSLNRLEQLQLGRESLVFGRIDRFASGDGDGRATGEGGGPHSAEAFHIGRLAVSDADQEPLVVDWRAPIAEPFYRATGAHPMGLILRRHFLTEGRRILDLEDELFGDDVRDGDGVLGPGLSGSAALLAALERSRTGRMRDIVATVQREQDEIIRGPLGGVLVVQGGPGTGKTAVALHRAAYLLYTHRFPLERQGVLVVGPNPLFLRYIEHVLPSLGETGVELSTVGGLFGESDASGHDDRETSRLKGDHRMARVLANGIANRQRPLRRSVQIPFGRLHLRLSSRSSTDIVAAAKRRAGTHNARRRYVEALVWRYLYDQYLAGRDGTGRAGGGDLDDPTAEVPSAADLGRELRRRPELVEALDRMWPVLTPQQFLHDLFGARPLIELAGRGVLTAEEQALLYRRRASNVKAVSWTEPDLALLDEARALLGPARRRPSPGDDEGPRSYGHIVADEAQDLSPMQLRMLGRRSLSGSMTIVGDIAQATGQWAPASWEDVVAHLPTSRGTRAVELTVNYRTPSEVMDLAARVLKVAAPQMRSPESVRTTGVVPRIVEAVTSIVDQVAQVTIEETAIVSGRGGTVVVICPPSLFESVAAGLTEVHIEFGTVAAGALDDAVTLVPLEAAKGLEFDSVVVVEPSRLVAEAAGGLRSLYVALTRATRRLSIVHAEPLPSPLVSGE
jgi:DNA helicase IV